jgi:DMSO/TMAO reductase YedYZ heme-binding membrane subunit
VIHYIWLVKADLKKPLEYAAVLAIVLLYRVVALLIARLRVSRVASSAVPVGR